MIHRSSDGQVRLALLGAGSRGLTVTRNWVQVGGCKLVAVVDPSQQSLQRARQELGPLAEAAEFVSDIDGWLKRARGQVDLVSINSWDAHHADNAVQCFEAGLNLIVAKPMTQCVADADRVYIAWKKSGCIGMVDQQIRTTLLARKAMEIINSGRIGAVKLVDVFDMVGFHGSFQRTARSRRKDMIRSLTLAKGVHFLDLCNCFVGDDEPARVFASGGRDFFGGDMPDDLKCRDCDRRAGCLYDGEKVTIGGMPFPSKESLCVYAREIDVVDNLAAVIEYRGGVRVSYAECHGTPDYETRYDIVGTKGSLFVRYAMDNRLYLELRMIGSPNVERIPVYVEGAHGGGDIQIVKDAVAAVREGRQIEPSIRAGRQAIALCEAIDRSIETGQVVRVPPLPEVLPSLATAGRKPSQAPAGVLA